MKRPSLASVFCLCVVSLLTLGFSSLASADHSVAVMTFKGRGGGMARNEVIKAIKGDVDLVSKSDVSDAADDLGMRTSKDYGVGRSAKKAGADFVIVGRIKGRGNGARTTIRAINTQGKEVASETIRGNVRKGTTRKKIRRAAKRLLDDAMDAVEEGAHRDDDGDESGGSDDERPPGQEDDEDDGDDSDDSGDGKSWAPLFIGHVGIQGRFRDVGFSSQDNALTPRYKTGLYPELFLYAELNPLAGAGQAAAGLTIRVQFALALAITSRDNTSRETYDTSAFRFSADIGYLYPALNGDLRIGVIAGFGLDVFSIAENPILPGVRYAQLGGGLAAVIKLHENLLQLRTLLRYGAVLTAGPIADQGVMASLGEHSAGGSHLFRAELGIGGEYEILNYWAWGSISHYSVNFGTPDNYSGTDFAATLGLGLGVVFR